MVLALRAKFYIAEAFGDASAIFLLQKQPILPFSIHA